MSARHERLYERAWLIRDGLAHGLWLPIVRLLAHRRHTLAAVVLADWYADAGGARDLGPAADPFSAAGLYRRAFRQGSVLAARNQAIDRFNRNDLHGYRTWLRRAARLGDRASIAEAARFETRLPHALARGIGRHRPAAKRDEFA